MVQRRRPGRWIALAALVASGCASIAPAETPSPAGRVATQIPQPTPIIVFTTPAPTPQTIYVTPPPSTPTATASLPAASTPTPTPTPTASPSPTPSPTPFVTAEPVVDGGGFLGFLTYSSDHWTQIHAVLDSFDASRRGTWYSTGDQLATLGNDGMEWINNHPAAACYQDLSDATFFAFSDTSLVGLDLMLAVSDRQVLKDLKTWKKDVKIATAALDLTYC